jgi:ABC-type transporter Mla MlaB component
MQDSDASRWRLRLPADCSISAIRSVYDLIREAFGRQSRLEIDCSDVNKADVTSIQLLLSTAKTAKLEGRSVALTAVSRALSHTFQRAGFSGDVTADAQFFHKNDGK